MTPWNRSLRVLGSAAVAVCLVLAGDPGRLALANGVGDLYVADAQGVEEVYLKSSIIESPIKIPAAPSMLAFTADGQTLYTADGTTDLYQIAIVNLEVSGPQKAAKAITAIAHPYGADLFLAYEGSKGLGVLVDGATAFTDGPDLPAPADLLAADPRETRFAAAAKGDTWVAVVEPSSSHVTQVGGSAGVGGKVVGLAVARAEGYVWVATTGPNRVAKVSLATGKVAASIPLDGAPTAITAIEGAAVVAIGSDLVKVRTGAASAFATASGTVLELATDLTAGFVYVATSDRVTAISVATPTASPAASVAMPSGKPAALAPVPNKGSSLVSATTGGTEASAGTGASAGTNGSSTAKPGKTHAPATDTDDAPGPLRIAGRDVTNLLLGVGALIVVVVIGSRYLIKRMVGEK